MPLLHIHCNRNCSHLSGQNLFLVERDSTPVHQFHGLLKLVYGLRMMSSSQGAEPTVALQISCLGLTHQDLEIFGLVCWFISCKDIWASQVAQWERIRLPMQETQVTHVQFLRQEDPLEEQMASHSSTFAWDRAARWLRSKGSELDTTEHERSSSLRWQPPVLSLNCSSLKISQIFGLYNCFTHFLL